MSFKVFIFFCLLESVIFFLFAIIITLAVDYLFTRVMVDEYGVNGSLVTDLGEVLLSFPGLKIFKKFKAHIVVQWLCSAMLLFSLSILPMLYWVSVTLRFVALIVFWNWARYEILGYTYYLIRHLFLIIFTNIFITVQACYKKKDISSGISFFYKHKHFFKPKLIYLFITSSNLINVILYLQVTYTVLMALIWFTFNNAFQGFQYFIDKHLYFDFFFNTFSTPVLIGIDGISIFFLNLTAFFGPIITIVGLSVSFLIKKPMSINFFLLSVLFSQLTLSLAFCTLDFFWFFFFFESVIIPAFYLIYIHGKTEKKLKATYYFVLYTILASSPFFVFLLTLINTIGTTNYSYIRYFDFTEYQSKLFCLMVLVTFLCKIPSFPFYVWLPEAHVEAGTAGSVLLASLILKLGVYGILRFVVPIFPVSVLFFSPILIFFACLSMFHAAVLASKELDLKKIIAYSSVSHMNFCLVGVVSYTITSLQGSLLFSLSHSFVSSGLFLLVGFLYDRYHSRDIKNFGSLATTMPIYSCFFFFFSLANCSMPGSISFISELLLLLGLFSFSKFTYLCSMLSSVFWSFYSLNVFSKICFGYTYNSFIVKSYIDLTRKEFFLVFYLLLFTVLLGVQPNVILDTSYMPLLNTRSSLYV